MERPKYCPMCRSGIEGIRGELNSFTNFPSTSEEMEIFRCSTCRKVFRIQFDIGHFLIKELWRHTGGGTSLGDNDSIYICDDSFSKGLEDLTIKCTPDQHFNLPFYLDSLEDLLELPGICPESKTEIERRLK